MKKTMAIGLVVLATGAFGEEEFVLDRSAMSEKYWEIWNDAEQAKIDADGSACTSRMSHRRIETRRTDDESRLSSDSNGIRDFANFDRYAGCPP